MNGNTQKLGDKWNELAEAGVACSRLILNMTTEQAKQIVDTEASRNS